MKSKLNIILTLGKVRITMFVSITTALGYILAAGRFDLPLLASIIGVFILSCGASALNQYQERNYDGLMERTKSRPIPSNEITAGQALLISLGMIMAGEAILLLFFGWTAFALGIVAIIWYNVIYTPLKRITSMAVVPGALIGSIPPVIGWVAGGGYVFDPQILTVGLFFFIWQIPHFWLLLLIFDKDYEKGGYPTLTAVFSKPQLTRVTYTWIVALAVSCFLIPLFGVTKNIYITVLMLIAGGWLLWKTKHLMSQYENKSIVKFAFMNINYYVLMVVMLLSADKFIKP